MEESVSFCLFGVLQENDFIKAEALSINPPPAGSKPYILPTASDQPHSTDAGARNRALY
jgi:hypothetical protein